MNNAVKFLEIRDAGTFIPALAVSMDAMRWENPLDVWLLRRGGFGVSSECVFLCKLHTGGGEYDPYSWHASSRTMQVAHEWIEKHFNELKSGDVVDVEFILGITKAPKTSERLDPQ